MQCAFYQLQEPLLRVVAMPEEIILPRCDDGERNGDEEKVDCGGSCDEVSTSTSIQRSLSLVVDA